MNLITFAIMLLGAGLSIWLYMRSNATDSERALLRTRALNQWKTLRTKASDGLHSSRIQDLFHRAGIRLKPQTYYILRGILSVLGALYAVQTIHANFLAVIPALTWFLLSTRRPWPLSYVLTFLAKRHAIQQRHDLFALMSHVKQELELRANQRYSVREVLARTAPRVPRLENSLLRLLTFWAKDPKAALIRFAEDMQSDHAKSFAMTLWNIEESDVSTGLASLRAIYADFEKDLLSTFHGRLKVRDYVLFTLAWGFIFIASFPVFQVMMLYETSLLKLSFNI